MSFIGSSLTTALDELIGDIAAPYALFYANTRFIGTFVPDVTIRELHTDEDAISQFPAETGSPVSDNVFSNPQVLEINFGCSDSTGGYAGYVQQCYQDLLALKATRQPFDVSTGKRYYTSMLFSNITVMTDETSEFALMVTARLQQVIITDSDASSSSQANQAFPSETAPPVNNGSTSPQLAPNAPSFAGYMSQFQPVG